MVGMRKEAERILTEHGIRSYEHYSSNYLDDPLALIEKLAEMIQDRDAALAANTNPEKTKPFVW